MSNDGRQFDRRSVLKTTGAALAAAVAGTGVASAELRASAIQDPTDVYDSCDGYVKGDVPYGSEGPATNSCTDSDGNNWYYVEWDSASPDGWAMEGRDIVLYE